MQKKVLAKCTAASAQTYKVNQPLPLNHMTLFVQVGVATLRAPLAPVRRTRSIDGGLLEAEDRGETSEVSVREDGRGAGDARGARRL